DERPARPVGPRLDRLRALVAAGRDPQYAAAEAERAGAPGRPRTPAGGPRHPAARPTCLPVPNSGQAHGTL
ncbi:hypothetical protein ACFU74_20440, partial [Kitasatospora sp. NPDC057500]